MTSKPRSRNSSNNAPSAPNNPGYSTMILVKASQPTSQPAPISPTFAAPQAAPTNAIAPKKIANPPATAPTVGIEVPPFTLTETNSRTTRSRHVRIITQDYEIDNQDGNPPDVGHREFVQLNKMSTTILPMCPLEGKFLLIRQLRYPAWCNANQLSTNTPQEVNEAGWLYETIAGVIEPGDTAEATAIREAQEEGNCIIDPSDIRQIHKAMMSPGITNEEMTFYLGIVPKTSPGGLTGLANEGERIRAKWMTREEIQKLNADGLIRDSKTLICLYAARIL
jgi:8-oxo-dGTP pyrophosphatase MutT (NUDIX family)